MLVHEDLHDRWATSSEAIANDHIAPRASFREPCTTHRPTGDTLRPADALLDARTLAALAVLVSIQIV